MAVIYRFDCNCYKFGEVLPIGFKLVPVENKNMCPFGSGRNIGGKLKINSLSYFYLFFPLTSLVALKFTVNAQI